MPTAKIIASPISDHTCEKLIQLGKKFFSDPKNQKEYEEWHKKEYGCLPNKNKGGIENVK